MRLLLLISLLFLGVNSGLGQNEKKPDFDQRVENALKQMQGDHKYVAVGVEMKSENAVFVRMGFIGFKGAFRIEITPVSMVDGKESRLEPITLETLAELDPKVLSKPTALIPYDKSIDSIEVRFVFSGGESPTITVPFEVSKPSFGALHFSEKKELP